MKKIKVPKEAKLVFKGVIYDVYQWQQKMFDGTYETFEVLKRPDTVIVIPTLSRDRILLLYQKQPYWRKWRYSLPGGRVDKRESPKKAALRELLEETGHQPSRLFLWQSFNPSAKVLATVYIYLAKDCRKVRTQSLDAGEKIILKKVTFCQFLRLASTKDFYCQELSRESIRAQYDQRYRKKLYNLFFNQDL